MHYFRFRSTFSIGRSPITATEVVVFLMQIHPWCSGRREDSPCSQCLGDDPQPFCSSKAFNMFYFLVLSGLLAPSLAMSTRGYTDCLTKTVSISRQNYLGKVPETNFCALTS